MLTPIYKKVDKSLETNHFKNLVLSIQLKLDGFSFSILNSELNKIVAIVKYTFNDTKHPLDLLNKIKSIFSSDSLLKLKFKEIKVTHINNISTLVPIALFNDDNLRSYLSFNHKLLENEYITFDVVNTGETANIYAPFTEINDYIFDKYGEFVFKHFSSILIDYFSEKKSNYISDQSIYVHVQNNQLDIVVTDKNEFIFYNSFSYKTKEDFIYYVLFVIEQLKLDTEEINLALYGDIEPFSDLYEITYKYVRNVSFGKRTSKFNFSYEFDNLNEHDSTILLNI